MNQLSPHDRPLPNGSAPRIPEPLVRDLSLAPTVHEEFGAARICLTGIEGMAKGAAAIFVILGFELKRLHTLYGVQRGRPQINSQARLGISWAALVKRELGISDEWARQSMAAADANRKALPERDIAELLATPLGQIPEMRRAQIVESFKLQIQAPSVRQLLLDLGIAKTPKLGGSRHATCPFCGGRLKSKKQEICPHCEKKIADYDPNDPAMVARDLWLPHLSFLEEDGLERCSWKDLPSDELARLKAIHLDLGRALKGKS